jgi:drug/metabolite transporter (DMT)-like permease
VPLSQQSPSVPPTDSPPTNKSTPTTHQQWQQGLVWALLSPLFLGFIPILAKIAYTAGRDVLTVVTFRTLFAALLLWLAALGFARHTIISSRPAVLSSLLAGGINGIGSLFFYGSLTRIDASLGQLINITYLIFVTILIRLAGQTVSWLTLLRTGLAVSAIYLLTVGGLGSPDWLGIGMMLFAALTFAIQLVLSQRILADIPAPTMTLYAITAMAAVVSLAWLFGPTENPFAEPSGWAAILGMGLVTALSRLALFLGVKRLGSLQAALLGILEVLVTIGLAVLLLGERLTAVQWLGAFILMVTVLLVRFERDLPRFVDWWQFLWRRQLDKK